MTNTKSLVDGIGNETLTEKYYDDWALDYDQTLKNWNYKAPLRAVNAMSLIKDNISSNLDLACGTGMFAAKLKKKYTNIAIDGCDISSQSLKIAKDKKLYRNLIKQSFEKKINITESVNKDRGRNLITIETSDNSGLLANIAKVFFENKISIFSARINTLGERVEDTFEIENSDKTLVSEAKIKKIISALKKVV